MDATELQRLAAEAGLDAVGAAPVAPYTATEEAIGDRAARGLFADMSFTMARPETSCHPETLLEGARTVISGALGYYVEGPTPRVGQAALPRYTWTDAYALLRERLEELAECLGGRWRVLVDENDHVDREAAARSGVGFYGKNTMIITPELGSWVVLGAIVTTVEVGASQPLELDCGDCRICIDACPTGALDTPGEVDAERCISYWTQSRRPIPVELRPELSQQAYGCDICQDVCPWNRAGEKRARRAERAPNAQPVVELREWLSAPDDAMRAKYDRLYFPRNDVRFLRRNAVVAAGAGGEHALRPELENIASSDDEFLAEHARWALDQIGAA